MKKMNCWEFTSCGRESGGRRVKELGVCPVALHEDLEGAHDGEKAGRACWIVAGTLCGGKVQGAYAQKLMNCWRCDFMTQVKKEEEASSFGFSHTRLGIEKTLEKAKAGMTTRGDSAR